MGVLTTLFSDRVTDRESFVRRVRSATTMTRVKVLGRCPLHARPTKPCPSDHRDPERREFTMSGSWTYYSYSRRSSSLSEGARVGGPLVVSGVTATPESTGEPGATGAPGSMGVPCMTRTGGRCTGKTSSPILRVGGGRGRRGGNTRCRDDSGYGTGGAYKEEEVRLFNHFMDY